MKTLFSTLMFRYLICLTAISVTNCLISEICSQCASTPEEDNFLVRFCKNVSGHLEKSCCVNTTVPSQHSKKTAVIGIDLSGCGLQKVSGLFTDLQDLQVIMLENNTDLQVRADDFYGLTKLDYLSLPETANCPGGNKSWASIQNKKDKIICHEEVNLCQHNNVTCLNNNSHCVLTGPGQMECLCLQGYHGYKCLRKGTFPGLSYTLTLGVCTVVISGFLWCTQRRRIKKKSHTY